MNAIVPHTQQASSGLVPQNMNDAMRLAEMMTKARTLPAHLQGSVGDCLMVVEQAMRWNMSPFAVAQCTSVISGKLMFEGKLVAAAVQHSGIIEGHFDYKFSGEGAERRVVCSATRRGEKEPKEFELWLKDAKTSNGMWVKQPDQQLVYGSTRGWARRHAPGVMLGVYAPEEFEEARPRDNFTGTTVDSVAEPAPAVEQPKKRTIADWLNEIEGQFTAAAQDGRDAVDQVLASEDVQKALDKLTNGARDRLNAIIKTAIDATVDDFPGVVTPREGIADLASEIP